VQASIFLGLCDFSLFLWQICLKLVEIIPSTYFEEIRIYTKNNVSYEVAVLSEIIFNVYPLQY